MHVCFSFCLITIYMTLWSNFLNNRINLFLNTSLHLVTNKGFFRCIGKCSPTQQMVLLWKFFVLYILCVIQFILLSSYSICSCAVVILLMLCVIFYFILFHSFIQLYPDVMGNYVMRLYGVLNLLCIGRWNSHYFIFISFHSLYSIIL